MKEEWLELDGFPDYVISSLGNVFNIKTKAPRSFSRNQQGLVKVTLSRNGQLHTRSLAVLVAQTFVPDHNSVFDTPIHLDGDRWNNCASNLAWRPRWFAIKYHQQFREVAFHKISLSLELIQTQEKFFGVMDPCIKYGLCYMDVILSYTNNSRVFPLEFQFRRVG